MYQKRPSYKQTKESKKKFKKTKNEDKCTLTQIKIKKTKLTSTDHPTFEETQMKHRSEQIIRKK